MCSDPSINETVTNSIDGKAAIVDIAPDPAASPANTFHPAPAPNIIDGGAFEEVAVAAVLLLNVS